MVYRYCLAWISVVSIWSEVVMIFAFAATLRHRESMPSPRQVLPL